MNKNSSKNKATPTSEKPEIDIIELATKNFGIPYLYPYQRLVIANILERLYYKKEDAIERQIIILPTGAGKSLCFTLPLFILEGITLIVFPLLSLIRDQQRRMEESGLKTAVFTGGQSKEEREEMWRKIESKEASMVLSNPETLSNMTLQDRLKQQQIDHFVIDEAHTVSEWGRSFRPAYLELGNIIKNIDAQLVSAFTATASERILNDIQTILFNNKKSHHVIGNPDRPNLRYQIIHTLCKQESLITLLQGLFPRSSKKDDYFTVDRPLLIFMNSRSGCEKLCHDLRLSLKDNSIFCYHAGLPPDYKKEIEQWFFHSDSGILISTCAYGMGVDKSNIRTVIHYDLSASIEAYLQEVGRAGRDKKTSHTYLLLSPQDKRRNKEERYQQLINVMLQNNGCRRIRLLNLLGLVQDDCEGCDVCDNTLIDTSLEEKEWEKFFFLNRHRFTFHNAINVLKGWHTPEDRDQLHYIAYGFGLYHFSDREYLVEKLNCLLQLDKIKISKFWWRGRLHASPKKSHSLFHIQKKSKHIN